MSAVECLAQDRIWFDKPRYDEAERTFYERMNGPTLPPQTQDSGANTILQDIARARENIQKSLAGLKTTLQPGSAHKSPTPSHSLTTAGGSSAEHGEILTRMKKLELENQSLQKIVAELRSALSNLESRVSDLEKRPATTAAVVNGFASSKTAPPPPAQKTAPAPADEDADEEDDFDLFGSDDEVDEEAERLKEQRLQEYAAKKAKKPAIIAKSSILLDVKPWDDETDMAKMEECVRSIQVDGLLWGASKLVPVGYGIKKLQINCVVEDDKVGTDLLEEEITKFEDYVQSVDVAAFNKI
ncbi:eukaryotic translation elongation factor 1 delta b (guanine nucleotide exchange protein) isoform 3-T4 [Clarias gariepinus]|nr:eukaryotic translation elongation factor 1 delta b (guanine nucleotide exchange protein) isoform X3 [Clarias gariepinus]XP_053338575.1 eukaryotic translation elongation factor 1 delta b (guanine nucleotide exchange protein) isoform X3 [Clarias gariepinus]